MSLQERASRGGALAVWLCGLVGMMACVETPAARQQRVEFRATGSPPSRADYESEGSTPPSVNMPAQPAATGATAGAAPTAAAGGTAAKPMAGRSAPLPSGTGGTAAPVTGGMQGGFAGRTATAEMPAQPATPAGPADGLLTVKLTSVDQRGRYSPRNCGAVWIESKAGAFVKTMERWCGIRAYYLQRWTKASGGWGGGRGGFPGSSMSMPNTADQMDAITAATLRSHVEHESTWKLRDTKKELVPDGDYKVVVEISDGTPHVVEFPFTKGSEAVHAMPPDASPLTGVAIDYQPQAGP